jgi:subtilisin family serine protease
MYTRISAREFNLYMRLSRSLGAVTFLFLFQTILSAQVPTDTYRGREVVANHLIVRLRGTDAGTLGRVLASTIQGEDLHRLSTNAPIFLLRSNSRNVALLSAVFDALPDVVYAEPDYIVKTVATPNDPLFPQLWGMSIIGAPAAWDVSTGSRANVVAVVDTGVDYTHPDLAANIWSAAAAFSVTIAGNKINCPAGSHGFNAITSSCDPMDDNSHGTHVSGTIGAVGNNATGVVGVNWNAVIVGLKFLDATGAGFTSDAINAMEFAIQTKALFASTGTPVNIRVLSASWGGSDYSQALLDEINTAGANEMLFVAAAGNKSANTDITPFYPAAFPAANLIAVAATDSSDNLASFSNYGATTVDLGAPGVDIVSTVPGNKFPGNEYASDSGTSMATPHVSGAALLALAACPSLNTASLKSTLLNTVDPLPALSGKTLTGGRLNVNKAIQSCHPTSTTAPTVSPSSGSGMSQRFTFVFSGVSNVDSVNMVINSSLSATAACYFIWEPGANTLDLADDSGSNLTRMPVGGSGTLSNSQCSIPTSTVSASFTGSTITVAATVTFSAGFAGAKNVWATWYSGVQQGDWHNIGSWTVPVTSSGPGVNPSSGSGTSQRFTFTFPGVSKVDSVNMLINSGLTGSGACYFIWEPAANSVDLVDDSGNTLMRTPVGGSSTLSNSQCSIPASTVSASFTGSTITVAATVTFSAGFAGAKNVWATWFSGFVAQGGWQNIGSWTVPATSSGPGVNPSSGSGTSQRFTFTFSGVSQVDSVNMLINSGLTGSGACYFIWEPAANLVDLVDDSGNTLTRTPVGGSSTLSNSQCSIRASTVSASFTGSTITVAATVTFTAGFTGPKAIWATWYSGGVAQGGWQNIGSWNVP